MITWDELEDALLEWDVYRVEIVDKESRIYKMAGFSDTARIYDAILQLEIDLAVNLVLMAFAEGEF